MVFDATVLVRAVHIIAASLWVGAAFLMGFVLGPSLRAAGPAAGPFMMTVARRGGLAPFFLVVGAVTILAGGYALSAMDYTDDAFGSASNSILMVGAIIAVLAYLDGLFVLLPTERRIKALVRSLPAQGPPPPATLAEFQALGAKQGKASAIGALLVTLSLLCMALRNVF